MKKVIACTSKIPIHVSLNDVKEFVEPLRPLAVKYFTNPDQKLERLELYYLGFDKDPDSMYYALYFETPQEEVVEIWIDVVKATKLGLTPYVLRESHWEDELTYFKIETRLLITPLNLDVKQFDYKLVIVYNIHFCDFVDDAIVYLCYRENNSQEVEEKKA